VHTANTCAEGRRLLKLVIAATREHFGGEERSVFPLLEKMLQQETLAKLGQNWMQRPAALSTHA
jgi:hemerythrin-like domain-containing protein